MRVDTLHARQTLNASLRWRREQPAQSLKDVTTLSLPHLAFKAQQVLELVDGAVLVQKLARAILDVKGGYDPEDDLVLQVQARPNDIEGFNLQVRARASLAQSACWSISGFAGLADHQLDVPVGVCGPHTGRPELQNGERACCRYLAGVLTRQGVNPDLLERRALKDGLFQVRQASRVFSLLLHAPFRSWVLAAGVQQAAARCWC